MNALLRAVFLALAVFAANGAPISFEDGGTSSGIDFVHTDGSSGRHHIVETIASGLGLIDFNNDGYLDIYFLNGAALPGAPVSTSHGNRLFRNNGKGTFTDVSAQSGVGLTNYSVGCAVADYDNDGDEDIFVTNYGAHTLLRNNGNGTFTDATRSAKLDGASHGNDSVGAGCAFLDFDRDGHLDLYVGHYMKADLARAESCHRADVPVYCDPKTFPPLPDRLFRNNGDGTFRDVSAATGIGRFSGYTMGVVCADFDGDGWTDIFVANDVMENYLFRNRGGRDFEEIGFIAGVAYDMYGNEQGSMGANAGDYDGDGSIDLFVTTYQNQINALYRNLGRGEKRLLFQDVSLVSGAGAGSLPMVGWGCGFVDFDNDGQREIFVANGHLQDNIERYDNASRYKQRNQLLKFKAGRFVDIGPEIGGPMQVAESSRGAVFGDLNNDGRIDVMTLNARAKPTIMMNTSPATNHWAILKLVGTKSNRSAVGAKVRVISGGRAQVDEVRSGRGYQSAEDLRLHFGLGSEKRIDRLEIQWPSGMSEVRANLPVDRILTVREGEGSSSDPRK